MAFCSMHMLLPSLSCGLHQQTSDRLSSKVHGGHCHGSPASLACIRPRTQHILEHLIDRAGAIPCLAKPHVSPAEQSAPGQLSQSMHARRQTDRVVSYLRQIALVH